MDLTKKPLGVVTMVYEDFTFLRRWYDYYGAQVGVENLYIFSHGNDHRHRKIARGANVMNLPRDETMFKFDRRRWDMLSDFASGMMNFYNWMIVADVDEILMVDPLQKLDLVDYLYANFSEQRKRIKNISPLCLELIHLPKEEPIGIEKDQTILSRRRIFRPNQNYSKPSLVGAPVRFGPGGHRNTLGKRFLPADLYSVHLKFFDLPTLRRIATTKKRMVERAAEAGDAMDKDHGWTNTLQHYRNIVQTMPLAGEDIHLPEFRRKMLKQREVYQDQFVWGSVRSENLYRIPERFADVF